DSRGEVCPSSRMAYSKSKYVEAAHKLLNQGKVAQAIAEYQNILKYEPRDQVTLMTIGELYIRQGETFQAIDYFERLAQIFVGDGFLTKAIAVYKRIAKLAPEEIRPLEKLADLYVQQGVMSEARPLFLQLAEIHLKNNRQPEAIGLLKKLLQAEPDNLRIQIRLADLYQAMGQTRDAIEGYVSASQRALARGEQGESEKLADKALKLDPNNSAAVIVKARSHSSQGNVAKAAQLLEQAADLEKGGEQTELLLDLYLKNSDWDQASALAHRVFEADEKNFGPMQKVVESLLQSGNPEKAMEIPKAPAAKLPVDDEEEPAPEVSVKPAAVSSEPALDEETQKFIAQSLTDVDLFASYGLTQKAIGLLEAILRRAPRHTPTLEKLLDFVLGAGDDRRTAELAAHLQQIHSETGDKRSSERFGELRRRFQRAAGLTDEELASAVPVARPVSAEAAEPGSADVSIREIAAEPAPAKPAPATAAPVEEARPEPVGVNSAPLQAEVQELDSSAEWETVLEASRHSEATVEAPAPVPT